MIINFCNKQKPRHYLRTKDLGFVFERERERLPIGDDGKPARWWLPTMVAAWVAVRVMRGEVREERETYIFLIKLERVIFGKVRGWEYWNFVKLYSDENVSLANAIFRHHKFLFCAQHFSLVLGLFGLIGDEFSFSSPMILIFLKNIYIWWRI